MASRQQKKQEILSEWHSDIKNKGLNGMLLIVISKCLARKFDIFCLLYWKEESGYGI